MVKEIMVLPSDIFAAIKDCSVGFFFLMFIYLQLCLVFIAVQTFHQLWRAGATLQLWFEGSALLWLLLQSTRPGCCGFNSCCAVGSVVAVPGLQSQAQQLLHSMWGLTGSGIIPVSPHWQGDFLPLSHQGSPVFCFCFFLITFFSSFYTCLMKMSRSFIIY